MKLYDTVINQTMEVLSEASPVLYPYDPGKVWKDRGSSELVMLRESAFELGGSSLPSVNYTCATTSGMVAQDEILVYGPDLPDLNRDSAFARIVILETADLGESTDQEKAFAIIRNLEFVRYHVFPAGYMVRVSSASSQEQVRISKRAAAAGIRFAYVGGTYIRRYRKIPEVKHVRVLFVTDPLLVKKLIPFADQVSGITRTLTHILDGLPTDCGHCNMKSVCDEVEGMRELHLGRRGR